MKKYGFVSIWRGIFYSSAIVMIPYSIIFKNTNTGYQRAKMLIKLHICFMWLQLHYQWVSTDHSKGMSPSKKNLAHFYYNRFRNKWHLWVATLFRQSKWSLIQFWKERKDLISVRSSVGSPYHLSLTGRIIILKDTIVIFSPKLFINDKPHSWHSGSQNEIAS